MPILMSSRDAIWHAYKLWEEWIGPIHGRGPDFSVTSCESLDRIHKSMRDEYRYQRTRADRKAVTREIRGKLILLGKVKAVVRRDNGEWEQRRNLPHPEGGKG